MTKKTSSKKISAKTNKIDEKLADLVSSRRKEWRFNLPLPGTVEGNLPKGQKFKEKIVLKNISSGGAFFSLDSGITIGSKLNLVIDIPAKLTEGKKVKLRLGGLTVRLLKSASKDKKQEIALSFDEDFQFISEKENKKENSSEK